jgi:hypothetical protein
MLQVGYYPPVEAVQRRPDPVDGTSGMEENKEVDERTVVTPGDWVMVPHEKGKRKAIVKKEETHQKEKKPRRKKGPTQKEKRMATVAFQCTNDVQTIFNWLAERINLLWARVHKHPEGLRWRGFEIRFYTTVKLLTFLDHVRDLFMSDEWFAPEVAMIKEKGYVECKPKQKEEGVHTDNISNQ